MAAPFRRPIHHPPVDVQGVQYHHQPIYGLALANPLIYSAATRAKRPAVPLGSHSVAPPLVRAPKNCGLRRHCKKLHALLASTPTPVLLTHQYTLPCIPGKSVAPLPAIV